MAAARVSGDQPVPLPGPPRPTGDLAVTRFYPMELLIGGGEIDAIVFANGLFEVDALGKNVPKKDLVFRVFKKQKEKGIDGNILVGDISTDDVCEDKISDGGALYYVKIKITIPKYESIKKGERNFVLKLKHEQLDDDGKCVKNENCNVPNIKIKLVDQLRSG